MKIASSMAISVFARRRSGCAAIKSMVRGTTESYIFHIGRRLFPACRAFSGQPPRGETMVRPSCLSLPKSRKRQEQGSRSERAREGSRGQVPLDGIVRAASVDHLRARPRSRPTFRSRSRAIRSEEVRCASDLTQTSRVSVQSGFPMHIKTRRGPKGLYIGSWLAGLPCRKDPKFVTARLVNRRIAWPKSPPNP
jgi:hypothetical protein